MSSFRESLVNAAKAGVVSADFGDVPMLAGIRNLQDCLFGFREKDGRGELPCKVTLFVEGGRLKVCVNSPARNRMGFGTLDPALPFAESLNAILEGGGLEWREPKKRQ